MSFIERVNWGTESQAEKMLYREEGRKLGDSSINQEKQRLPEIHQKQEYRHGTDSFSQPSKGTEAANTLISGL